MFITQTISAILLLLSKFYISKKNPIGWIYGIVGTILITIYFYIQMVLDNKINLWILIILDIALLPIMIYGYLVYSSFNLKKWNILIKIIILISTIYLCLLFVPEYMESIIVLAQFISVVLFLFGTLLLAFNNILSNILGWILFFCAHILTFYVMYSTNSFVLAIFQIFSVTISVYGVYNELKIEK